MRHRNRERTHTTWSSGSESTPAPASAKAGTAKKAMKTTFYNDLQNLQKKYYMFLRASVILYMDDDAQRVYKTILAEKDKDMNLPMAKKYEPKHRIKWEWIKNQIYTQMCCSTNGNYYYKTLMVWVVESGPVVVVVARAAASAYVRPAKRSFWRRAVAVRERRRARTCNRACVRSGLSISSTYLPTSAFGHSRCRTPRFRRLSQAPSRRP